MCPTLILALAFATAVQPDSVTGSGGSDPERMFEGVAVSPFPDGGPPFLVRFELLRADSSVVVTPLGRAPLEVGPLGGFPELPAASDSAASLRISARSFLMMAEQVEGALADAPPGSVTGLSVRDGRLRVELARGVSIAALLGAAFVLVAASAGGTALALRRRGRRQRAASRELQRRLIEAGESERTRVAREIHDGPLQDLHAVRARAAADPSDGGGAVAREVGDVARELRAIAEGLRPPALGRFGLPAALASYGARVSERSGVRVRVRADEDAPPLDPAAEASMFRVAQEAVTNAVRHGRASTVTVEFAAEPSPEDPRRVRLEVCDDGSGLPPGLDADGLVADGHFGLAGMRERADLLGGALTVGPVPNAPSGTAVRLVVPWRAIRADRPRPHPR